MMSGITKKRNWMLVIAAVIGLAGSASAQMITGTDSGLGGANSITGTVLTPSGQRMERRIAVRLSTMTKGDRVATTDESGNFGFRGLVNGDYQIVIDKDKDYEPYTQNVNVFQMRGTPGQNFMLSIRLKLKPGNIPKPGVINAELADVPQTALNFYKKATELANTGDQKGAIEQFKLAVADHPKFTLAYNDLGVQYLKLNDLRQADEAFTSALNIDRASFAPLQNHGVTLYDMKQYAKAEPVLRDVIKAKPDSAVGHFFLGQTLANLGKFAEGEKELISGMTLGGEAMAVSMKEGYRLLAIIYSVNGMNARAAGALESYLKLAPKAADAEKLRERISQLRKLPAHTDPPATKPN